MLEPSHRDFKITTTDMSKDLQEKVDKSHEQIENFSRKMELFKEQPRRNPETHTYNRKMRMSTMGFSREDVRSEKKMS